MSANISRHVVASFGKNRSRRDECALYGSSTHDSTKNTHRQLPYDMRCTAVGHTIATAGSTSCMYDTLSSYLFRFVCEYYGAKHQAEGMFLGHHGEMSEKS